jgi:hypothetical protein
MTQVKKISDFDNMSIKDAFIVVEANLALEILAKKILELKNEEVTDDKIFNIIYEMTNFTKALALVFREEDELDLTNIINIFRE